LIDYFAIALTHGLLALAAWRLLSRDDLDNGAQGVTKRPKPWLKGRSAAEGEASRDG
jgi:hypothetical protein